MSNRATRLVRGAGFSALLVVATGVLFVPNASADPGVAHIGPGPSSNGIGVQCAQTAINYRLGTSIAEDGRFGQETYHALMRYQQSLGVQADGTVGSQTGELVLIDDYDWGKKYYGKDYAAHLEAYCRHHIPSQAVVDS